MTFNSATHHRFYSPFQVASQLLDGKSLYRALFNLTLKQHTVSGNVVDLGSKSLSSSYFNYLRIGKGSELIFTDIMEGEGIVKLNVEEEFPFSDNSLDCALAFNLFEHVYNHNVAPGELFRTLRSGGDGSTWQFLFFTNIMPTRKIFSAIRIRHYGGPGRMPGLRVFIWKQSAKDCLPHVQRSCPIWHCQIFSVRGFRHYCTWERL